MQGEYEEGEGAMGEGVDDNYDLNFEDMDDFDLGV